MIFCLVWLMVGYIAFILYENVRIKRNPKHKVNYKQCVKLMILGWFGLGYIIGKFYR